MAMTFGRKMLVSPNERKKRSNLLTALYTYPFAVQSIQKRGKEVRKCFEQAEADLARLLEQHPTHTVENLEAQWARQKEMQKKVISESAKDKRKQLGVFLQLEEDLLQSRYVVEITGSAFAD